MCGTPIDIRPLRVRTGVGLKYDGAPIYVCRCTSRTYTSDAQPFFELSRISYIIRILFIVHIINKLISIRALARLRENQQARKLHKCTFCL